MPLSTDQNVVERCIGWLKCCRRNATRYEKLAMIQRCLRLLGPSDKT
ncbi:MAG: hypothetical protein EA377_12910 [Phycisphaerales bacterium]|nr:MAG: hypothetical protein EA377_12910 [Phycisphaerales bacterium]